MTDWSEIFEQRLQAVLQDESGANESAFPSSGIDYDLELTPPPTRHRISIAQRPTAHIDPTSAFFESIQNQSRPRGRGASYVLGNNSDRGRYPLHYGETLSSRGMFTPAAQITRTSSPLDEIDRPDMKELQECYSSRAQELHSEATKRMTEAGAMLQEELGRMAAHEDSFLSMLADKQSRFSQPAEAWMVKVQMRDNHGGPGNSVGTAGGGPVGGGSVAKNERIVDRIAAISAAAANLESDLTQLWAEWGQAHAEAKEVLQAMSSGGGERDEEFQGILAKAKTELDAAAAEVMKEMDDNEKVRPRSACCVGSLKMIANVIKTFKKMILAEECKLAQMMLSRQSKYD
ncbi:GTPase activating factor [Sporothrix epigloea]|uniref:GTPase activating factor n=1 Tax=Sporothrix epigloea TaxID=1892477 RepID=A0ABP0DJ94_9PEZI